MEGLSVRTLFTNCAMQIVIFLYLIDNDTSWMILISQGIGLVIEIWKVTKAVIVNVKWRGIIPVFSYQDRASYASKTKVNRDQNSRGLRQPSIGT